MPTITAMVLTRNEEKRLRSCLERLAWADEMLVIDSFSTDGSVELARSLGVRVLQHEFAGFSSQINWGLEQAASDWILMVDADEWVTPKLRDSVRATLQGQPAFDVYEVVRDSYFLERPMRASSWSNDRIPRLFRKGAGRHAGLVHPRLESPKKLGLLEGKLIHHTYDSIEHYFLKIQSYTTLGARDAYAAGKRVSIPVMFLGAIWRFFHNYLLRGEIWDGRMGLLSSGLAAVYTFTKYAKLWGLADADRLRRGEGGEKPA